MNYPHVIAACAAFANRFGTPVNVFYPGCGSDSSPSVAFPDSTVVYCDPNAQGLDEIKREFRTAITLESTVEDVQPGARYELVLNVHSQGPFEAQIRDLRRGGHLLIMNKMSDQAFDHQDLVLVAAMNSQGDKLVVDTDDLERYYEEDPTAPKVSFSNRRKIKALFYVFCKK